MRRRGWTGCWARTSEAKRLPLEDPDERAESACLAGVLQGWALFEGGFFPRKPSVADELVQSRETIDAFKLMFRQQGREPPPYLDERTEPYMAVGVLWGWRAREAEELPAYASLNEDARMSLAYRVMQAGLETERNQDQPPE
jgi:hypothetical protein